MINILLFITVNGGILFIKFQENGKENTNIHNHLW
jgi:hypothetical protein